jgi:uncharacterized lipoprotein NlpE involved in copper resistance
MQKLHFKILAFSFFLLGCSKPTASQNESEAMPSEATETSQPLPTGDNSQTSLDWAGTYFNTLPCEHCEGIETWVTLNQDGTFELKTNYLGLNDAREEIFNGKFQWDESGSFITLEGLIGDYPGKFKVGENQLWYLNQAGHQIEGPLTDQYILKRR